MSEANACAYIGGHSRTMGTGERARKRNPRFRSNSIATHIFPRIAAARLLLILQPLPGGWDVTGAAAWRASLILDFQTARTKRGFENPFFFPLLPSLRLYEHILFAFKSDRHSLVSALSRNTYTRYYSRITKNSPLLAHSFFSFSRHKSVSSTFLNNYKHIRNEHIF